MKYKEYSFKDLLLAIIDNRGKTCPTSDIGIPLIATNCIKNNNLYPVFEKIRYVEQNTYDTWFRGHPEPGDMIFVCKGSPGRITWVPDPINFCIAQDMVAIRADTTKVYPKFLFALLRSHQTQNKILNMHVGTLIPHFKKGDFGNLYFDIPEDMEYQKVVGDTYFEFCEKIELNRQTNQTLEQIAQAIFKSWFIDFEPVKAKITAKQAGENPEQIERAAMCAISGKTEEELGQLSPEIQQQLKTTAALFPDALVDSELGEIPVGWEVGLLDDLCLLNSSSWTKKNSPIEVLYVDLANTKNGVIEKKQPYLWEDAPSRARRIVKAGDTIIGTVRPGNRSFALIGNYQSQITASTGFAVLTPKKAEFMEFIYIAATSDLNIERLAHLADGAAYPAVRPDVVTQMEIAIPSKDIINIFHNMVKFNFKHREENLKQSSSLTKLRDTLLPKLLSGELALDEAFV